MRPRLGITLPNHWSIKNIVHSGVAARLGEDCDLVFIVPTERVDSIRDCLSKFGVSGEVIGWNGTVGSKGLRLIRHLQKSMLYERQKYATEFILSQSKRGNRTQFQKIGTLVARRIARTALGKWALSQLDTARQAKTKAEWPDDLQVDAIFTTNPFDFREDPLVKGGQLRRIPQLTMIPSWDNLSSKGVLFTDFDLVLTWNDGMSQDVIRAYPWATSFNTVPSGLPRFAAYESAISAPELTKWLIALGLDPDRETVLFANTATKSFPDQPDVARDLAHAIASDEIPNAQLLIRCHPHDDPEQYAGLAHLQNVVVWPKSKSEFGVEWAPGEDDLDTLRAMIEASDVVVNAASTIVLDAAACDKPTVSIAYDGHRSLPTLESVASFYDYTHQRPFLNSNAAEIVTSRRGMVNAINDALAHPNKRQEERAKLARVAWTGNAVERFCGPILNFFQAHGGQQEERAA